MKTEFRAEQVGSLLRPAELLQARAAHAEGRLPEAELRHIEDSATNCPRLNLFSRLRADWRRSALRHKHRLDTSLISSHSLPVLAPAVTSLR